jgi:hypothetical protein
MRSTPVNRAVSGQLSRLLQLAVDSCVEICKGHGFGEFGYHPDSHDGRLGRKWRGEREPTKDPVSRILLALRCSYFLAAGNTVAAMFLIPAVPCPE